MLKNVKYFIYALFFFHSLALIAVPASKYTRIAPLPVSDNVRVITFDEKGFLWIGTSSGLLRYDGYQFIQYRNTMSFPSILSNNSILSLSADRNGSLWAGTDNGITRLDMQTGVTHIYKMPSSSQKAVACVYAAPDGSVFAGTGRGVFKYDDKTGKFVHCFKPTLYNIKAITCDKFGNIFIGTERQGLWMAKRGQDVLKKVAVNCNDFTCLKFDSKGRLWTTSWHEGIKVISGVASKHPNVKSFQSIDSASVYNIIEVSDGSMMACSRNVIYKFDPSLKMTVERDASYNINAYIAVNRTGTIALAKKVGEVDFSSTTTTPLSILNVPPYDDGISRGGINSMITVDGNNFWLFSRMSGISTFNSTLARSSHDASIKIFRSISDDLKNSSCQSSLLDSNGNIWIGNTIFGLISLSPNGKVEVFNKDSRDFLHESGVFSIAEDHQGRIWFGQRENVVVVNPNGVDFNIPLKQYIKGINNGEVTHIMQDRSGRVWICTRDNGLLRIDALSKSGKLIKTVALNQKNGKFQANGAISSNEDGYGNIFFITSAGELLKWDNKKGKCEKEEANGISNDDRFYAAITDSQGNAWFAATNYLVRLRRVGKETDIRRFYVPLYSPDVSFQENSTFRRGDILYFGSTNNIITVNSRLIDKEKANENKLTITDISLDGRSFDTLDSALRKKCSKYSPTYTKEIKIPHGIRLITLGFTNMNFVDEDAGCFAYKLDGYNNDWTILPSRIHEATFINLTPGKYTFHLRCTNSNGQWMEMPYSVLIRVLPPWWATRWAFAIYLLIFFSLVYICFLLYRRHIRTQNKLQIARVFTNLTHELLTPLSIISASVEAEKSNVERHTYSVIHNNIVRLARLIRQMLEVDKINSNKLVLRVNNGDLASFIQRETDNMRPLAEQKNITINFTVEGKSPRRCWFDTDKLDKTIYNLLSNAIKYTQHDGEIEVSVAYNDKGKAIIKVKDNGIGISKSKVRNLYTRFMDGDYRKMKTMGTGIGLSLTHDLTVLHHGTIVCDSIEGKGTVFTITIPVDKEAYSESEIDKGINIDESINDAYDLSFVSDDKSQRHVHNDYEREYTVLLVEDNKDLLDLMDKELSTAYNILRASNGKQALYSLAHNAVDIVVSDIMMPVMDGIELTREIKKNDDFAMLPVVLLTAKIRTENRNEGYLAGADDYLTKPFSMHTLKLRIDNIISNRERIRRKFMQQEVYNPADEHYSDPDTQLMERCVEFVKKNITKEGYGREQLAADMCMSSSSLYKKLRELTGEGVTGFINSIRLKEACRIMRANPNVIINDLYLQVGYNSASYFRRVFKQEFGITPTEFINNVQKDIQE